MARSPINQGSELPLSSRGSPSDFSRLPDNCLELIVSSLIDACTPAELVEALGTCKNLHRGYKLFAASSSSNKLINWILEHVNPGDAMTRLLKMGLAQKPAAFAALATTGPANTGVSFRQKQQANSLHENTVH